MDIPACTAPSGCTSPPHEYEDVHLYEEIPATLPPLHATATAPPTYINNFQEIPQIPQNHNRTNANPYPVLNVPPQIAIMTQEQMFVQQQVRTIAPQVIMVQPQRVVVLGDTPTATVCQYCYNSIITNVKYKPGCAAWGMCLLLTVLGLICGICLIPFCVSGFQDAHHTCPYCHRHLGVYVRK
ncbi:lipopolysaccharide-induced tumor necrosis factor-alpha factor homolog [Megalobrama amblycephala]|uniref:lipopolysaccharide-induced tumor necrosis factor-alpha factor homolog n=1 Tax=Megalobrama amblycephala TaxID=75352 RepID=UPI00201433E6|nr:lipopolysaccharide-induced tumor necrosis factor-alpha factor homolog [Megalobrama amblycephala]